jgi:hypothetical protein
MKLNPLLVPLCLVLAGCGTMDNRSVGSGRYSVETVVVDLPDGREPATVEAGKLMLDRRLKKQFYPTLFLDAGQTLDSGPRKTVRSPDRILNREEIVFEDIEIGNLIRARLVVPDHSLPTIWYFFEDAKLVRYDRRQVLPGKSTRIPMIERNTYDSSMVAEWNTWTMVAADFGSRMDNPRAILIRLRRPEALDAGVASSR